MKIQNNQILTNSTINITSTVIKWGNHIIKHPSISHIWTGNRITEPIPIPLIPLVLLLFFIALSCHFSGAIAISLLILIACAGLWFYLFWKNRNVKGIHFQLVSGTVYSFISNNDDFTNQVFELINEVITDNTTNFNFEVNFNGDGTIEDTLKSTEVEDDTKLPTYFIENGINVPIINELQLLHSNFSETTTKNLEIIKLIEKTMQYVCRNDKEGLKNSFSQFIVLGLIKNCNELGLITLIESIKSTVY